MELCFLILALVAINGTVAIAIRSFIRSAVLFVSITTFTTEALIATYFLRQGAHSPDAPDVLLGVNLVAMFSTPFVLATSIGFFVLIKSSERKRDKLPDEPKD